MRQIQYLDDLAAGQKYGSGSLKIDADAIKRFAAEFDPQPFHLNEQEAAGTLFQGLAASGWHTAALTMRLLVTSEFKPAGGVVGASLDELRWPCPVRPGDVLSVETEVLEVRPSKSRPEQGMVKVRVTTYSQKREVLQRYVGNLVVKRQVR
jgi:acyl dehydratase